ncbi:MAG TPA: response regulator transcription factor [Afifellaceae bacterium]|nr:response regulator transcription factor [Afifellaceae bacterium]
MRILIVEDDLRIAEDVKDAVEAAGFVADIVHDGEEAWFVGGTEPYDAVILDLGLPGIDGLTILKRWRSEGHGFPVLILTARSAWQERVDGIDAGADDYLVKPFQIQELVARLRAIVRRASGHASTTIEVGPLAVDTRMMSVSVNEKPISLSPLEYRLVAYLAHNQDRVITQTELSEHLYAYDGEKDSNAVEVLIGRVRRKLGEGLIETKRGFGYLISAPAA